jgi:amidase
MKTLEDIVQYNIDNVGSEGGTPGIHPAFGSGQDGFLASLESKGIQDETYWQALSFCQRTSREEGIDAALRHRGANLDALLLPSDIAQAVQIAAQAGYPIITIPASVHSSSYMPYGLAILGSAFSESVLIKYACAMEDLFASSGSDFQRSKTPPTWSGHQERNIPVAA